LSILDETSNINNFIYEFEFTNEEELYIVPFASNKTNITLLDKNTSRIIYLDDIEKLVTVKLKKLSGTSGVYKYQNYLINDNNTITIEYKEATREINGFSDDAVATYNLKSKALSLALIQNNIFSKSLLSLPKNPNCACN
jgi:hypothetical protein